MTLMTKKSNGRGPGRFAQVLAGSAAITSVIAGIIMVHATFAAMV